MNVLKSNINSTFQLRKFRTFLEFKLKNKILMKSFLLNSMRITDWSTKLVFFFTSFLMENIRYY